MILRKVMQKKIGNVLSLFDGMSCGQLAMKKAGITYEKYFASEIDKNAIKITQHNFPSTVQLGDVTKINKDSLPQLDLLIGGSPCQGFSFSGKMLNFDDPRSKLFFEFVRIKNECQPKYWLLENVVMKKEFEKVITSYLGIEPVKINSALVSAQNRERLYWANFAIKQPRDLGIKLIDILEDKEMIGPSAIRGRKLNKASIIGRKLNIDGKRDDYNKDIPTIQYLEVRGVNRDKSNCLTTVSKDNVLTTLPVGRHPDAFKNKLPFRYYTLKEYCRLQTVPDDYFSDIVSESQAKKMLGNGWTVDVIAHILDGIFKD
jgi:DNA (cytosine-5)-methyltransferase 3A